MKLLIIRHGDPDYAADSVTEKGAREVEMLSERLSRLDIHTFYVSPLGRAQRTAAPTLQRLHKDAVTLPWLREFQAPVQDPETDRLRNPWDFKPAYWMQDPRFYDASLWTQTPVMQTGDVASEAQRVYQGLDDVLARHGYCRKGLYYEATAANTDTIAFVCHFGVECVMLSHLMNISPMPLWHHFCALPSSVTTLVTEEREKGIAVFRCLSFGDLSHLYAHGEEPSFAARFCEVYDDFSQRH